MDGSGVVATLGPGDFFGEMAVVTGRPRSATVEVVEAAELLKVPADKLQEMVLGAGEVAIRVIRNLAERLENANRFIDVLLEDDVSARVILEIQDALEQATASRAPDITEERPRVEAGHRRERGEASRAPLDPCWFGRSDGRFRPRQRQGASRRVSRLHPQCGGCLVQFRVLGCHGGETPKHRTSSFLVGDTLAVDAGALTGSLSLDEHKSASNRS